MPFKTGQNLVSFKRLIASFIVLAAVPSLGCKPRATSSLAEAADGVSLPEACVRCHVGLPDLPAALKNPRQLEALTPFMNRATREDMARRARLEGDALAAFTKVSAPAGLEYARSSCQAGDVSMQNLDPESSPLAAELQAGVRQNALTAFGRGSKTWQGSTDNDGRRARLLSERNAPNPFMYDLMGYNSDGAREFPWKDTAGTDVAEGVKAQKFLLSPSSGAFQLGTRDRASNPGYFGSSVNINGPQVGWDFFPGTMLGEVVSLATPAGDLPFEIRLRRKVAPGLWTMDVLRPFATREDFVSAAEAACAALSAPCGDLKSTASPAKSAALRDFVNAAKFRTKRDPLTLNSTAATALQGSAAFDELPVLPDAVVAKLLKETPFRSVFGQAWFKEGAATAWAPFAPASGASVVPRGYLGAFLPLTYGGCMNCHAAAGRHVDRFDPVREQMYDPAPNDAPRPRTWYHFIPGDDAILSFHPFSEAAVQRGANILASDLKTVDRETLDECLVDFSRPAGTLTDEGATEETPNLKGFVPGPAGSPVTNPSRPAGGTFQGPGATSTTGGAPEPGSPRAPSGSNQGQTPGGSAAGTCYCVVRGSQCVVTDARGVGLVFASAADICLSADECNQELYQDVAHACRSPLQLGGR